MYKLAIIVGQMYLPLHIFVQYQREWLVSGQFFITFAAQTCISLGFASEVSIF